MMKKNSFLKKIAAVAAAAVMACVLAVSAFAEGGNYVLNSATIKVGGTWTLTVPSSSIYDWDLSSEYISYGHNMADKKGVLKYVSTQTVGDTNVITYEAVMPGTCTVTLTNRSTFAKVATATVTVTGADTADKGQQTTPAGSASAAKGEAAAPAADSRTAQQKEIDEAKANGTWGTEYTTCPECGFHNWTRKGNVYVCDTCGHETTTVVGPDGVKGYVGSGAIAPVSGKAAAPETRYATAQQAQAAADQREADYAAAVAALQKQLAAKEAAYLAAVKG